MELCNLPIEIQGKILSYLYFKPKPYDEIHFLITNHTLLLWKELEQHFKERIKTLKYRLIKYFMTKTQENLKDFSIDDEISEYRSLFFSQTFYITTKIYNYIMFEYHLN
jgi:hypothetical protein